MAWLDGFCTGESLPFHLLKRRTQVDIHLQEPAPTPIYSGLNLKYLACTTCEQVHSLIFGVD